MDAGADLVFAQDLLRHNIVTNTRLYARLARKGRDEMHRAVMHARKVVGVLSEHHRRIYFRRPPPYPIGLFEGAAALVEVPGELPRPFPTVRVL